MDPILFFSTQPGPVWDWRVAVDLFAGGVGVGAFLFAVVLSRVGEPRYQRLAQTAAVIAPFLVMLGLAFLFWKVGNKLNVYQMAINLAPTSLMWWGFWLQSALVALGLLYAWQWRGSGPNSGRSALGLVVGLLALLVGVYHGLLLAALTSHPLWATGSTVFMAMLAFVSTGIAGALIAHLLRMALGGKSEQEQDLASYVDGLRPVKTVLAVTLLLILVNVFLWWADLSFGSLQSRQALSAAIGAHGTTFLGLGLGLGVLLPLLLMWAFFGPAADRAPATALTMIGLTSILVLVGGFFIRYAVVLGGQVALPIATLS